MPTWQRRGRCGCSWTRLTDAEYELLDGEVCFRDVNVTPGQAYTYTARCLDKDGSVASGFDRSGVSAISVEDTALSATVVSNGVSLRWAAAKGAEKYVVFRGAGEDYYTAIAELTGTSYVDPGPLTGWNCYYIACVDKNGKVGACSNTAKLAVVGNEPVSGTWGEVSWTLDEYGVLTISGEGAMAGFPEYASTEARGLYYASIRSLKIENGVTRIGSYAFSDCYNLTSVTIADSVTNIGSYAFRNCSRLIDVYYGGTQEQWNAISLGSDNSPLTGATIHYDSYGD